MRSVSKQKTDSRPVGTATDQAGTQRIYETSTGAGHAHPCKESAPPWHYDSSLWSQTRSHYGPHTHVRVRKYYGHLSSVVTDC